MTPTAADGAASETLEHPAGRIRVSGKGGNKRGPEAEEQLSGDAATGSVEDMAGATADETPELEGTPAASSDAQPEKKKSDITDSQPTKVAALPAKQRLHDDATSHHDQALAPPQPLR